MKTLKRIVAVVVVLGVVAGGVFYERPLWVGDQQVRFHMWRAGMRSEWVMLPEGRVHFYEMPAKGGDGTPLVIVHGLGGRSEDFASLGPRMAAQGFHVYAPDLLGYGRSDRPDSDYSIRTEERVLTEFMDAEHLARVDLVGWSMGGWITMRVALDSPQRVERLVVLDSVGITFQTDLDTALFAPKDDEGLGKLIHALSPTMRVPPGFVRRDIVRRAGELEWVIDRSMKSMKTGRDLVDFQLPKMQPPMLIVWGAQDVLIPPSVGVTMHEMNPRSLYVTVDGGCGHFLPVECSATTARVVGEFLKAEPAVVGGEMKLNR